MLSHLPHVKRITEIAAKIASATARQQLQQTRTVNSIMTQKMLMPIFWLDKLTNTVKPQEVNRRNISTMQRKDLTSDNNMRANRRLNYAETSKCTETVSMVTPAHMHMANISFRRRPTFQATSWPSFAHNITKMVHASMVRDANSYTVFMTSRVN